MCNPRERLTEYANISNRECRYSSLLDAVLSVEDVQAYKPHPAVYQLAKDRGGPEYLQFFASFAVFCVLFSPRLGSLELVSIDTDTTEDRKGLKGILPDCTAVRQSPFFALHCLLCFVFPDIFLVQILGHHQFSTRPKVKRFQSG
jgi:hypothetical protein